MPLHCVYYKSTRQHRTESLLDETGERFWVIFFEPAGLLMSHIILQASDTSVWFKISKSGMLVSLRLIKATKVLFNLIKLCSEE